MTAVMNKSASLNKRSKPDVYKSNFCKYCEKEFTKISYLRRHIANIHEQIYTNSRYEYVCETCSRSFSSKYNFKRHVALRHNLDSKTTKSEEHIQCCMCDYSHIKSKLLLHYHTCHRIDISIEKINFNNIQEFEKWKEDIEKNDVSKYIIRWSSSKLGDKLIYYYRCHRDGFFKSRGKNVRRLKHLGSNKINTYCPSKINVIVSQTTGKVSVKFLRSHVGHQMDLGKIPLSKDVRDSLAEQISHQVPFNDVLNNIRDNVDVDHLDRLHLLTRSDLYNIEKLYNLKTNSVRNKNDCVSVEAWVKHMRESSSNTVVRFYKGQGEEAEVFRDDLQPQDFLLVIMNDAQLDMLKKYGSDLICIDSTQGLGSYDFELISLAVVDELKEAFPCLFAFTNRCDETIFRIIFEVLKCNLDDTVVSPRALMSDTSDSFYNAWCTAIGPVNKKLYFSWDVRKDWKRSIESKIKNTEHQETLLKVLMAILGEEDLPAFESMLEHLITDLRENAEFEDFAQYFESFYVPSRKSWAYCYRMQDELSTNIHIERMHQTLQDLYVNGKRLDKTIQAIMKFVRNKLFERIITLKKGKLTTSLRDLHRRHKNMENLLANETPIYEGDGTFWTIPSADNTETYKIEIVGSDCYCELKCAECDSCIHEYICSCPDSSIKWNMCKHIHLVCQHRKKIAQLSEQTALSELGDSLDAEQNIILIYEDLADNINIELIGSHTSDSDLVTVEDHKAALANEFNSILSTISNTEECKVLENALVSVRPMIEALKAGDALSSTFPNVPPLRFYSQPD